MIWKQQNGIQTVIHSVNNQQNGTSIMYHSVFELTEWLPFCLSLHNGYGCGSFVRISPETPLLATRITLYASLLYKPGWHYETWAGELFIVWNLPRNFASHSVPFSSELYRAYFEALVSTKPGLRLTNYAKKIYKFRPSRVKRLVRLTFN